jgi:hypothetical protein
MCYVPGGTATFVGIQRITGTIGDRAGSFILIALGEHDGKRSKGTWTVIGGSGSGEISGLGGEGTFEAPGGPRGSYSLEYQVG